MRSLLLVASLLVMGTVREAFACDLPVCTDPAGQDLPRITFDGAGGAIVVWRDLRNSHESDPGVNVDLYAQHVLGGLGTDPAWPTNGVPLTMAPRTQDECQVASDGSGGLFAVWTDNRDVFNTRWDIYAQHVLANGTIAPGWPADGLPICTAISDQVLPKIAADGAGGAFVIWEDHRAGAIWLSYDGKGDIYGVRIQSDGSIAPGWTPGGTVICGATNDQEAPAIAADGLGGIIVAWGDYRTEATSAGDAYAIRMTDAGAVYPGWPIDGVRLTSLPGPQSAEIHVVSDGAGGAFVGWMDDKNYANSQGDDIGAQHVTGAGTIAASWPADGILVCSAPDDQYDLDMISDGSGGAYLVWDDYRNYFVAGGAADIYAQHLTFGAAIAPGWAVNGNLVSGGPGFQTFASLALDDQGGMFAAFESDDDVYVQHLRADGSLANGWPASGRALCTGTADDHQAAPVSDGAGGMIIASNHNIATGPDIYASWVRRDVVVPALVALTSAEAEVDHVALVWFGADANGLAATVERRSSSTDWQPVAAITADGTGTLRYEDRDVTPGARYGYRLEYRSGAEDITTEEAWVDVPKPALALRGFQPNPAVDECTVSFTLAEAAPAHLEVFDVAGRRMLDREVGDMGIGTHTMRLDREARFAAGVYTLRLTQTGRTLSARGVVLH